MKQISTVAGGLILVTGIMVLGAGCGSEGESPTGGSGPTGPSGEAPIVLGIEPADETAGVDPTSTVGILFNTPMDTLSVESCFYLSGGQSMHTWMDSLGHHHRGGMGGHMRDMDHMIAWMDSVCYEGDLHWNAVGDSCYFEPGRPLPPGSDHMIYLYGSVRSRDGIEMDMTGFTYGGPMSHFRTRE